MTATLSQPTHEDLLKSLRFSHEQAEIWLDGRRHILTESHTLGAIRRELVNAVGREQARAILGRIGYEQGMIELEMARRIRPQASLFDLFTAGPQLHELKGMVKVDRKTFEYNPEEGRLYVEYYWLRSAECEGHVQHLGIDFQPAGWQNVGYASSYASTLLGRPFIFREIECVAMGHSRCFVVGKPSEEWDDPDVELRYLRAENYLRRPNSPGDAPPDDLKIGSRQIVGASAGFNFVLHLIDKVAETNAPVLFLGESGVGKEVFARELHKRSSRAAKPLISVNCAAIPEGLVESELFGVEKGAFTGAVASREGRFERANGGTLFLDEIGTLSLAAQGKLLRVLQEGECERVGGSRTIAVDARIVAATNADLRKGIREGTFREDLFHRLNVFPVRIPPLRERRADIPLLINHFVRKYAERHCRESTHLSANALDYFIRYDWPGNVRELENMVERGVILAERGSPIELHHILTETYRSGEEATDSPFHEYMLSRVRSAGAGAAGDIGGELLDRGLKTDDMMSAMIQAAMHRSRGNVSAAARLLGMTRMQLSYRLRNQAAADEQNCAS
ncbi:MAG: DNA-binding protein Fis [Sphingomonas bacterium]|nr:sigma-54-dependent Fis family transcriptional regulator [Sphingomonas bacterium]MDB5688656.1 DNA-binding protein Fis [Sphingomonas bacterium]